ncbi:hypothetical protein [Herbaspirillum seropedicae]|uniref:hypothetical protein n=1 Tax=Herbaspirillum seropedicae TaxID=964 RepID=UPI003FCD253B
MSFSRTKSINVTRTQKFNFLVDKELTKQSNQLASNADDELTMGDKFNRVTAQQPKELKRGQK